MAPFGKNFLKARLKNSRTKDAEPTAGKEIQVTVCNEEKVVCGVTKHTTCADMIQALLEDHRGAPEAKRLLQGEAKDFCLVERWKGFERALPPLTRILRLWYAWGDQRPSIQFVLVKTCDFVPQQPGKTAKAKSGAGRTKRWEQSRAKHPQALPADKQKRLVKKAFRKLERLHQESRAAPGAQEVDRMVQLILNQDHTIRQQIQRMRELDLEIQQVEAEAGVEERQEAEAEEAGGWCPEAGGAQRLQEFMSANDGVERLELQVQMHKELIQQLSLDIDAELQRAGLWEEEGAAAAAAAWPASEADESFYAAQLKRLQGELQYSLHTGVSLHNQAAQLDEQLQLHEATLLSKDRECWQLAAHLEALQLGATAAADVEETPGAAQGQLPCPATQPNAGKTLKGSTSPLDATDTDSDTGISSTHSQDSLSPCLDFPPPLDTDV